MVDLHEACYRGDLARVRELLEAGADPSAPCETDRWVTAATSARPLNCVAIAWTLTPSHLEIARLLLARGAVVDDSVLADHAAESTGSAIDAELHALLAAAR